MHEAGMLRTDPYDNDQHHHRYHNVSDNDHHAAKESVHRS
jgi:hypothetical protein